MKFKNNLFGIAAMALCLGLASCSDDDELQFSQAQVTNSELKTILEQNGLHFDDQGHLLLDEAANNLKALDLSGKKISDYKELSVLPNLVELNLSNNEFGPTFDFGILPSQIKVLDLTGNEIYEVANLADINEQTGAVTLKLDFDKLTLPETAKYDCYELPQYFITDKEVDMKLGTKAYSNLREVPDANTLAILKASFKSLFDGDKIDISRRLVDPKQKMAEINTLLMPDGQTSADVTSVEGVEYVAMNKGYEGGTIQLGAGKECILPYIKIGKSVSKFTTSTVATQIVDFSEAENITCVWFSNNTGIQEIDLSASKKLGQRSYAEENGAMKNESTIDIINCENFKSLKLPKAAKIVNSIQVGLCPNLESLDLSGLRSLSIATFATLPKCKISYPQYDFSLRPAEGYARHCFGISPDMWEKHPETKEMLDKYHDGLDVGSTMVFAQYGFDYWDAYQWDKNYK